MMQRVERQLERLAGKSEVMTYIQEQDADSDFIILYRRERDDGDYTYGYASTDMPPERKLFLLGLIQHDLLCHAEEA